MIYQYLNFFIGFQVMCLVFATGFTVFNVIKLWKSKSVWFPSFLVYNFGLATHTFRRVMVLVNGNPAALTKDAMIYQTIIAITFLTCAAMSYALIHPKK